MSRRIPLTLLVFGVLGVAWAGVPVLVSQRGWTPLVALAGAGNQEDATRQLEGGLAVLRALLHGRDVDEETDFEAMLWFPRQIGLIYPV